MIRLRFTALWFLFGPVLGCMWLAAVNYENNLVYAVLYLVGALTFVSVFHTCGISPRSRSSMCG